MGIQKSDKITEASVYVQDLENQLEHLREHGREQFQRICALEAELETLKDAEFEIKMVKRVLGYYD